MPKFIYIFLAAFLLTPLTAFAGDLRLIQNINHTCGAYDEWPEDYTMQFFWSGTCKNGLADGDGIAIFLAPDEQYFFIFIGTIQTGYLSGEARIEWGNIPDGSPVTRFVYPFFSLSDTGVIGRTTFSDGKMNGRLSRVTGKKHVYTQNYVDNSPVDSAVTIDVERDLIQYNQLLSYILGFEPLGHGCEYALHLYKITRALRVADLPMLGAVGYIDGADSFALFDCVYWNDANNPDRDQAMAALESLSSQGQNSAESALFTISHQEKAGSTNSSQEYYKSLPYRESDYGIDYRIMADFPVSYMLSQGEAEFMKNAPPEFEDETQEAIARLWLLDMAVEIGSGRVSKATVEDMREFTPNMLLSFVYLDPNGKYSMLSLAGQEFGLDQALGGN